MKLKLSKLLISLLWILGYNVGVHAKVYPLAPKQTQCYLFSHDKLQQKLSCTMTATAATGKIWWTRRDFQLANGSTITTLAKDTQRKYLAKTDKILMPVTVEGKSSDDQISIATLNHQPAIRQNRLLKDYHVLSWEEFWGGASELTPSELTDRLACLQVENKSFELCTPYADNDFRTD